MVFVYAVFKFYFNIRCIELRIWRTLILLCICIGAGILSLFLLQAVIWWRLVHMRCPVTRKLHCRLYRYRFGQLKCV